MTTTNLEPGRIDPFLQRGDLQGLFIDLGWTRRAEEVMIGLSDGQRFKLKTLADKKGVRVFQCHSEAGLPDRSTRQRIEREAREHAAEHLIIFTDASDGTQVWQWSQWESGQPTRYREYDWRPGIDPEGLRQRLERITFSFDEHARLTLTEVTRRLQDAVPRDRVTKKFFNEFGERYKAFRKAIKGIDDELPVEHQAKSDYATLMLNRLMFCWFIQQKGFLNGDPNYLKTKLKECKAFLGEDKYHSFYRSFLLVLFHKGLGLEEDRRSGPVRKLIGEVKYLNGGLFEVHRLEQQYKEIAIPDKAFRELFEFFDTWNWHLDERPIEQRDGREINPDILGYIFEQFINQKQMGAYYTKEDITDYIGKNTIGPFLLNATREHCQVAFQPDQALWRLFKEDPDRYLYDAVLHGVIDATGEVIELPAEIAAGLDHIPSRSTWNRAASAPYALPTETWREHVHRRQRTLDLRQRLRDGEIHEINELITWNLNIRQFLQDAVDRAEGPEFLRAFYQALSQLSVLDPTCGSGAFLFAAMNILEPLYEGCLERMQAFIAEADAAGRSDQFPDFRRWTQAIDAHPSRRYAILKAIVVNNLYGVDIMPDAVEICKLRLFLKLVAQIDRYEDLEALPDIDFNIRAGNTLVGFPTRAAVEQALTTRFDFGDAMAQIDREGAAAAREFAEYQALLLSGAEDSQALAVRKESLQQHLASLREVLNRYLAEEFTVRVEKKKEYAAWLASHQPFHWFVEFFAIMSRGGFDVIIGNPPYVRRTKVFATYQVQNFATVSCPDIYALVVERCTDLLMRSGFFSMILPLSLGWTDDFDELRRLLFSRFGACWFSSFGRIPAALFNAEVRVRNTIVIAGPSCVPVRLTSALHRWNEEARPVLLRNLRYAEFNPTKWKNKVPKLPSERLISHFERCIGDGHQSLSYAFCRDSQFGVTYKKSAYNWISIGLEEPPAFDVHGKPIDQTESGWLHVRTKELSLVLLSTLAGKLGFCWWLAVGDDFHVVQWMLGSFPVSPERMTASETAALLPLASQLEARLPDAVHFKLNAGKRVGSYDLSRCRDITDLSDQILAQHMGLLDVWEDIELYYAMVNRTDARESSEQETED